ncbi:unnamed protein product [Caenorhabditis auriculariae]|uniref:Glutathione S-transferase kappa n=1 Tax=Caenorhabditis auriculariae TaxID=2777116 RepID=A0A8S1HRC2_9PELO|nr:unnamed protein product [Caenorhabditis auriculariae]
MGRIELYFDVISPYSWIAFEALTKLNEKWNIEIQLKPFYLGEVMKRSGSRPPALVKAKGIFMVADLDRSSKYWGIPLNPCPEFMRWMKTYTTEDAQKVLLTLQKNQPELLEAAAREFWLRLWSRGQKIFEKNDLLEVLKTIGARDIEGTLTESKSSEVANLLEENISTAVDQGAFGAPWIVVHDDNGDEHYIFGSDRMHHIADILSLPLLSKI